MHHYDERLREVCPLILPTQFHGPNYSYSGFLSAGGKSFYFKVTFPENGQLKDARLDCDLSMSNALSGFERAVDKSLQQSKTLASFLIELKALLTQVHRTQSTSLPTTPPPPLFYSRLLAEIDAIGWQRVTDLDQNFSTIKFKTQDSGHREHILTLHLTENYPATPPMCIAELPLPFNPSWVQGNSLLDLLEQFEKELLKYQLFWDTLKAVDENCWVLEPEHPTFACTQRRIVVEINLSVQVTVDPLLPTHIPLFNFLGPDKMVTSMRDKLFSSQSLWDNDKNLLDNIKSVLCVELPSPASTSKEEYSVECGICYSHRLTAAGAAPDVVCDNTHCAQAFHHTCLMEWLQSLPSSSRGSFAISCTLSVECPYCSHPISVKSVNT